MFEFITLFFPAMLSVALYEHLRQEKLSLRGLLYCYVTANLFINIACILIKMGLYHVAVAAVSPAAETALQIAADYLLFSVPAAIFFAFIAATLKNKVSLVKKSEDNEKAE